MGETTLFGGAFDGQGEIANALYEAYGTSRELAAPEVGRDPGAFGAVYRSNPRCCEVAVSRLLPRPLATAMSSVTGQCLDRV
jgi:hypothetical protein